MSAGSLKVKAATTESGGGASLISVVVPAYNEQEVIAEFVRRTVAIMESLSFPYEIVFVNDGSRDGTLLAMQAERARNPNITIVDLSRNFGKEIALSAGIDHAAGDAVVVIDADLQDPPELIPELVARWREGFDVVFAQRTYRDGETWLKKATADAFYRFMQALGPVSLPRNVGDFRLLDRKAVDALKSLRERHRFMKGLFAWIGYRSVAVSYRRDARFAGTTKWSYWRLWNLSLEGITSFTVVPLQIATYVGLATALFAFVYGAWTIAKTLLLGESIQGFPTIMVTMLFLGGVQLTALGIIGEYLGRIFNETKARPLYLTQAVESSAASGERLVVQARRLSSNG